jgi:hypothetical protein
MAEKKKTTSKVEELAKGKEVPSTSKIDVANLEGMLENGDRLFVVKNSSDEPLVLDWNLELLPADLEDEFNKYLEKKYLEYGQEGLIGGPRVVAIFQEGRTINFLNSFLTNKKFPIVLPRNAGREEEFRSSFVLNAGESVILTETQKNSLNRFEKMKRVWEKDGKRTASPWLGFLVFTPIQEGEELLKYSMSYVTSDDTINSAQDIGEVKTQEQKEEAGIIRATE